MQTRADITECFVCGYSLAGHPAECRCSECGMAFDEATVVFRTAQPNPTWRWPVFQVVLGAVFGLLFLMNVGGRQDWIQGLASFSFVMGGVWQLIVFKKAVGDKKTPFLAISTGGIIVRQSAVLDRVKETSWEEVRKKCDTFGSGWSITSEILGQLGVGINKKDAKAFREALDRRVGRA